MCVCYVCVVRAQHGTSGSSCLQYPWRVPPYQCGQLLRSTLASLAEPRLGRLGSRHCLPCSWIQLLACWRGCWELGICRLKLAPRSSPPLWINAPLSGRVGLGPLGEKLFFFFSFPAIGEVVGEGVLRDRGSFLFKSKWSCRPPIPAD